MSVVGLPDPPAVWLAYLLAELIVPWIIIVAHALARRHSAMGRSPLALIV